jgi:pantothenate kinase type III
MSWRLYVDIGNSAVKYGARRNGEWVSVDAIDHMLGRDLGDDMPSELEELGELPVPGAAEIIQLLEEYLAEDALDLQQCSGIGVCNTCDAADELVRLLGRLAPCPLRLVGKHLKPGLKTEYRKPSEIGPDRWANVVAAVALHGAPVIVLDAGTCLTSEVVNSQNVFVGGSIALGMTALSLAVAAVSERLTVAMLEGLTEDPPLVGRSTTEAIHGGLALQLAATADRFASEGRKIVGDAPVVLTGGHGGLCLELMETPVVPAPLLTLEGIRLMDHYD